MKRRPCWITIVWNLDRYGRYSHRHDIPFEGWIEHGFVRTGPFPTQFIIMSIAYPHVIEMTCRAADIKRETRETQITVDLNLDGTGKYEVECDIQFLRHMVETLARYAEFDLKMSATGDNDHHLIEDVAITLGKALRQALGDQPIERMATSTVVMDDAMVMTSLDLVDRPYCEVDCPDPLYVHFFRSFAMTAGITLHILVIRGFDEHHLIEAGFKSMGKALKEAIKIRDSELSNKGSVRIE